MFRRFVLRDFRCSGVSKPMPVVMAVSTDLAMDMEILKNKNKELMLSHGDATTYE